MTYNDYLKKFYPEVKENVSATNNWFLSKKVIHIFKTHFFYKKHVRWNIERFEYNGIMEEEVNEDVQAELPLVQVERCGDSDPKTTNENSMVLHEKSMVIYNREEETTSATWVISKRKAQMNEYLQEFQTRTQPKRAKKTTNYFH